MLLLFFIYLFSERITAITLDYSECSNKLCVTYPEGCISAQNCQILLKISESNSDFDTDKVYTFDMYLTHRTSLNMRWIATALSDDRMMGDDDVVVCYTKDAMTKGATFMNGLNVKDQRRFIRSKYEVEGIKNVLVEFDGTILRCKWTRERYTTVLVTDVNGEMLLKSIDFMTKKYFALVATGSCDESGELSQHSEYERTASYDNFGALLYKNCEQTQQFNNKLCIGLSINDTQFDRTCISKQNCDIMLVVKQHRSEYMYELRLQDIRKLSVSTDILAPKVNIAIGLSIDDRMTDTLTIECQVDDYKLYIVNKRNLNVIQPVTISANISRHEFNVAKNILECRWMMSEAPIPMEFEKTQPLFLFITYLGKQGLQTWRTDYPLLFRSFYDNSIENDCKAENQCFGLGKSEICLDYRNCIIYFSVAKANNTYLFKIVGNVGHGAWIAIALSTDEKMGDDLVFECFTHNENMSARVSWNLINTNIEAEVYEGIESKHISLTRTRLSCMFQVNDKFSVIVNEEPKKYTLSPKTRFHVLMAFGKMDQSGQSLKKMKHDLKTVSLNQLHIVPLHEEQTSGNIRQSIMIIFITAMLTFAILCIAYYAWNYRTLTPSTTTKSSETSKSKKKSNSKDKAKVPTVNRKPKGSKKERKRQTVKPASSLAL